MKKIIISILLILTVSFLSGCSIDWSGEKDKKITELEKQNIELKQYVKNLSFDKQNECQKLKDLIKNKLLQDTIVYKNRDYQHIEELDEIFYSPKINSCLYSVITKEIQSGEECNFHKIYDYNEESSTEVGIYINFKKDTNDCDYISSEEKYKKALKELKGE